MSSQAAQLRDSVLSSAIEEVRACERERERRGVWGGIVMSAPEFVRERCPHFACVRACVCVWGGGWRDGRLAVNSPFSRRLLAFFSPFSRLFQARKWREKGEKTANQRIDPHSPQARLFSESPFPSHPFRLPPPRPSRGLESAPSRFPITPSESISLAPSESFSSSSTQSSPPPLSEVFLHPAFVFLVPHLICSLPPVSKSFSLPF